jgi:hypothetical protein
MFCHLPLELQRIIFEFASFYISAIQWDRAAKLRLTEKQWRVTLDGCNIDVHLRTLPVTLPIPERWQMQLARLRAVCQRCSSDIKKGLKQRFPDMFVQWCARREDSHLTGIVLNWVIHDDMVAGAMVRTTVADVYCVIALDSQGAHPTWHQPHAGVEKSVLCALNKHWTAMSRAWVSFKEPIIRTTSRWDHNQCVVRSFYFLSWFDETTVNDTPLTFTAEWMTTFTVINSYGGLVPLRKLLQKNPA